MGTVRIHKISFFQIEEIEITLDCTLELTEDHLFEIDTYF